MSLSSLVKPKFDLRELFDSRKRPKDEKTKAQRLKKAALKKVCLTKASKLRLFEATDREEFLRIQNFSLWVNVRKFSRRQQILLDNISLEVKKNTVLGIIGPSGAGKSLLLSSMTKGIFDTNNTTQFKCNGQIFFKGTEILSTYFPVELLRRKIGWISQTPVLFPLTVRENVLFALRARGLYDSKILEKKLENVLRECALWDELKDRLESYPIDTLSQGQAQRLCIARALILEPEILLMDEPTSSLDPASTSKIEQLILNISKKMTVILVSHSLSQIMHVSDYAAFIKGGKILESGTSKELFTSPKTRELRNFISGLY
ncbi:phosphate ABC transporter ATP-binding protein [Candidatus Mycoplasma haematominutum]|uniref:Phosphate import ATP-binding protein PstB n=1 Tax=Candidatus Mycoplasma haematominutum 'Birmingham 1' TaxID=1116213 RepID=G8C352_9MOLU|nr:ATP-binding cassette domain-containing protein [Candidatus Mycoplasma haematominutum]CCE66750.1 phosphate import ATP-binding protein PstB [Candidatus Mycoplasma haematominutum 'Birmingham 1']